LAPYWPGSDSMKYRVRDLTIDTGRQVVTRDGGSIALPKLSYDLLLALVRAAPNLVSLDELMRLVWPGIIVSPETVSQRVKLLRDALGDEPREPRYIAGLRGRGYHLVAAVQELETDLIASAATSTVGAAAPRLEKRHNWPLLTVVFAVVAVAAGWILVDKFRTQKPIAQDNPVVAPALPAISEKSIAVLPFVDMSEKKDQEYFADGMSEELIATLTRNPDLRIPARTSSFYFKGKQVPISDIAKSLRVEYVLEGSVRKSGTTLRTTVELVRASNGYHLWSDTYDRDLQDVFKVQDDIAVAVVKALKISLLAGPTPSIAPTVNPEAYALYLQARFLERRDGSGDYAPAVAYLKKALDIDPRYPLAWAELALVHITFFDTFTSGSVKAIRQAAEESADKALTLNANLSEAHLAKAMILSHIDWDWNGAEDAFQHVLLLDPANSDALLGLAKIAAVTGHLDQALELCKRVIARDPLNDHAYFSLASLQSRGGDYKQSEVARRKVLELNPTGATGHFWLGYVLLAQGKASEALAEMEREQDAVTRRSGTMLALDALGRIKEADQVVAEQKRNPSEVSANIAAFYACRKDADRAFNWLERAYVQRDYYITGIGGDFCFNNLKSDARYKPFLRKMRLPE